MTCRNLLLSVVAGSVLAGSAHAADWITSPSYYSHDPVTGERVTQYSPIGPFYTFGRSDYRRSGFRHTRSSLQAGNSADHLHIVEEWGRPIRPYGEWRFPYRPYSVPYPAWGPPFPNWPVPGFHPWTNPPHAPHAPTNPYDAQQPPPYYEGSYHQYRSPSLAPSQQPSASPGRRHGAPGHKPAYRKRP
jgi:hypothetical protein